MDQDCGPQPYWLASGLLIFFFIVGATGHSFGFAGIDAGGRPPLWHCYNVLLSMSGIFAVLSARELGYWWLFTIFLVEVPVEARGTLMSWGSPLFRSQLVEVIADSFMLAALLTSKPRYFRS